MDGWPYVGGGAFCRPVGCADPFPMPGRDRDFSARRALAMRAILSPPRKLWNIRRLAVAASGRGSMAHPPRKNRPLPLWSHFSAASSKFHPAALMPQFMIRRLVCVAARKGIAVMRVMRRNAASTKPHFSVALEEELHPFRLCSAASVFHCKAEAFSFFRSAFAPFF